MTHEVTFYTRQDCPLCDAAEAAVRAATVLHHLPLSISLVDVDKDPVLQAKFTNDVPVIYVDGVEAFRHRVTADELAAWIAKREPHRSLAQEACVPCRGGVPPLQGAELTALAKELGGDWRIVDEHHLEKEFTFPDFAQALAFTNRVGAIAEREGHHPDIYLAWGKVRVTIWTHKAGGLTRADFVLAAKIDQ
ncbi:MAG TPA: 4a-hydroxytetrahydrobiopterin dehydratase [Thermoanaerobaculia bacterium]|jgi:4a-hydroxytetrahydrobiopterin dehydratase|nr:4a-hydroxytetrahydrobiopterin dehydratase [Thermoanaerobaculia bacterium]